MAPMNSRMGTRSWHTVLLLGALPWGGRSTAASCHDRGCDVLDDSDEAGMPLRRRMLARPASSSAMKEAPKPQPTGPWGLDLSGMNRSATPGDSWYDYVNGKWLKRTKIPSDRSSFGMFTALYEESIFQVWGLLQDAPPDSLMNLVYTSFMDEAKLTELGASPIQSDLDRIASIADAADFARYAGETNFGMGSSPFGYWIGADDKNPDINVGQISQSGLGLPSRDYYLEDSFAMYRGPYVAHIARMLGMVNWPDPEFAAQRVLDFETSLAGAQWPKAALRDPIANYNPMTPADLPNKAPGFEWAAFFQGLGDIPEDSKVIVMAFREGSDDGIVGLAKLIGNTDLGVLKDWAAWHLVSGSSSYLSPEFYAEHFDFYGKELSGMVEPSPRWKRAVSAANGFIQDLVGKAFVQKYYPEKAKTAMLELTGALKTAFARRIMNLDWMSNETKGRALDKLDSFTFEIGEPQKFLEYEGLTFAASDLFGNAVRSIEWRWNRDLKQLGQPVDDSYWEGMGPQQVNAFFDPSRNRCVFLAGILQPPFFNADADMSVNFGGIGAVIGHEMTHGFDDSGRNYDKDGRLDNWWTPEDAEEFENRSRAYGEQFAQWTAGLPPGMHENPELTMGENIADLGGVTIALDAYHMWAENNNYEPQAPLLERNDDGLEGDRRFFAAFAQVWRSKYTEDALKQRLTSDPHSVSFIRATIPLQNTDLWYSAYEVTEGQTLYLDPSARVQIW